MAALALFALPLRAQVPDSARADSARADSAVVDSLDATERRLASERSVREGVPGIPFLNVEGPRPAGTVWVWTRDSLDWSGAETVGDLLLRVPGLFLVRGGWVGRPELPSYLGRSAASVEYMLDGLPYEPLGPDSTAVDAGTLGLSFLERIEVERAPGSLRVHMFTRRHDVAAPLSRIGIATGDQDFARYEGLLTQRGRNGLGYGLGLEVLDVPDPGISAGYQHSQFWAQVSWLPRPDAGVLLQGVRASPDREPFVVDLDTLTRQYEGTRQDLQLRAFLTRGAAPRATRFDLLLGRSTWDGSRADHAHNQAGVGIEHRRPTLLLGATALARSGWTTLDVRTRAGWAARGLSAAAEGVWQQHRESRSSAWVRAQAGAELPLGFTARGEARAGSQVLAPALESDESQSLADFAGYLGWSGGWLRLEGGLARLEGLRPPGSEPFPGIDSLLVPTATWATGQVFLTPAPWLALEGWFGKPLSEEPDGLPPFHGVGTITLRSKFLRQFPSGVFDLRLQLAGEIWDDGILGRRADGTPVPIEGNSLTRASIEIQIGRFLAYYHRTNLLGRTIEYVPGVTFPNYATSFGVRWEFLN